ncbi:MAG: hypothetical protein ABWK00_06535 [Desulfurococcaceae archaeon]
MSTGPEQAGEERLRRLSAFTVRCPICGSAMELEAYGYRLSEHEEAVLVVGRCNSCGYQFRDFYEESGNGPVKVVYRVEGPGDERAIVYLSSEAQIEIPELGLLSERGARSTRVTTVEGIVMEFIDALEKAGAAGTSQEKLELLRKAKDGLVKYTVIIRDPTGISRVISDKATREREG